MKYRINKAILFASIALMGHAYSMTQASPLDEILSQSPKDLRPYTRDFEPIQQGEAHNSYIPLYTPFKHASNTIELSI